MNPSAVTPFLLFLGDATEHAAAKTAAGIVDWCPERVLGQFRLAGCRVDLGLPDFCPKEAAAAGARTMVIGIANAGGVIPETWLPAMESALDAGLDLAAGLHRRLTDIPRLKTRADRLGRRLIDVRDPGRSFPVGTGRRRTGLRLLTVGTDCAVGKKYTALTLAQELRSRGCNADFRATGQTGIFIADQGVAVDAVVSDFASGAAESISPDNAADHWDVIEGQGTLFHPAFAGVTLALLHGSQPDAIVVCHQPRRESLVGTSFPVPDLQLCLERHVEAARLTNPHCRAVGISLFTKGMSEQEVSREMAGIAEATGLPCADPVRHGLSAIVDSLLAKYKAA